MKRTKINNFQNVHIEKIFHNPKKYTNDDITTIIFIRDPYEYFDYLLFDYLSHKRSILFTQDIINNMKNLNSKKFLHWLKTLNFIPFYNPQTFQLNRSKNIDLAIEDLENYDYVVPYDKIDIFLKNTSLDINIDKRKEKSLLFTLKSEKDNTDIESFIDKDLKLYMASVELWKTIVNNDFKPLSLILYEKKLLKKQLEKKEKKALEELKQYQGGVNNITSTSISGWIFHTPNPENTVVLEIYKNNTFLCLAEANQYRELLIEREMHTTGLCGFRVTFNEPTFHPGDNVEIKILPNNITFPLGNKIKNYLNPSIS